MFIWPFDEMKHNLVSQEPSDEGRSYTNPLLLQTEAQLTVTLPGCILRVVRLMQAAALHHLGGLRQQCIGPVCVIS